MTPAEEQLSSAALDFLGPQTVSCIQELLQREITATDIYLEEYCADHGADSAEIQTILAPPPGDDLRMRVAAVVGLLLLKLRRESA